MARSKKSKVSKIPEVRQQPTPPTHDELSDAPGDFEGEDLIEKDKTELELEKLVFGDNVGFREGLKSYKDEDGGLELSRAMGGEEEEAVEVEEEVDLEALNDTDVFTTIFRTLRVAYLRLRSYSSLTPDLRQPKKMPSPSRKQMEKQAPPPSLTTPLLGSTAMTSASRSL